MFDVSQVYYEKEHTYLKDIYEVFDHLPELNPPTL